jgi:hypothetical protein
MDAVEDYARRWIKREVDHVYLNLSSNTYFNLSIVENV